MDREAWIKNVIAKQPTFDSKNEAIQAAIKANAKLKVHEVWQEPKDRGGRYVVAEPQAFETLYREKYERVLDAAAITDIERGERGDDIDEIEEV